MSRLNILLGLLVAVAAQSDYDYVSECPEENGFFADALQCDRYYECSDGEVSEHFCPDGLVFDETSTAFAKCGFPFAVDCTGREDLQPAQPSPGCPRANGYFAHPDDSVCDKFVHCSDGTAHSETCAGGLVFDPSKGLCNYADQTDRPGCTSSALYEFACPESSPHEHTRHAHPDRCDQFYLCITGRARRQSCSPGLVFSTVSLACEGQEKVEGPCSRFYNSTYLDSLTTPAPLSPALSANRAASQERRRPVRPLVNRQPQPQPPPEQIPQQLLDLQNFGQSQPGPSAPVRGRVPATRLRQEEKESFFNNLRGSISSRDRDQAPARPFTRPPLRRPAIELQEDTPRFEAAQAPATNSGFGRRRQPFRQRTETGTTQLSELEAELARRELQQQQVREELGRREQQQQQVEEELARRRIQQQQVEEELARRELQQQQVEEELARRRLQQQQVEEELARREQQQQANLGPSALDALISRGRQDQAPPSRGSLRRGPVSRGGAGRGRLEVLDNRRPALQPQEEEEEDFASNFNSFRQRNSG